MDNNQFDFETLWFNKYALQFEGKVFNDFTFNIEPMNGAIILQRIIDDEYCYISASPFWDYDMGESDTPAININYERNNVIFKSFDVEYPYPENETDIESFMIFYSELLKKITKEF